jgi:hypothetical protein
MHNWLIFQYRHIRAKLNIDKVGAAFGRTCLVGCG